MSASRKARVGFRGNTLPFRNRSGGGISSNLAKEFLLKMHGAWMSSAVKCRDLMPGGVIFLVSRIWGFLVAIVDSGN